MPVQTSPATANKAVILDIALDGLPCQITCAVAEISAQLGELLAPFAVSAGCTRFAATGLIRPYIESEVMRHMSPTARAVPCGDCGPELYREDERYWLVDEHWGICEINFLRHQWRSWILPAARTPFMSLADDAVLWPLAQILRCRGLHMLPAVSVARAGWGALVLTAFSIAPELSCLAGAGYRVIGQRWTALRLFDQTVELLALPGWVQRETQPSNSRRPTAETEAYIDLAAGRPDVSAASAACSAIVICEPGRRSERHLVELTPPEAHEALRSAWPIMEIHPVRRPFHLAGDLARGCRCFRAQLSRRPEDLAIMLDWIEATAARVAPPITTLSVAPWARQPAPTAGKSRG